MKQRKTERTFSFIVKKSSFYLTGMIVLFLFIGIMTTITPAYRISSSTLTEWTNKIESSTFLYMMGMESRAFQQAYPKDKQLPNFTSTLFEIATSIKPDDPRSFLGNEIPGFSIFDNEILIAGEGADYTNLPIESSPPLEDVLEDREAVVENEPSDLEIIEEGKQSTGDKKVVFIYNTHNTESFLPHLPGEKDIDKAHHKEVNITKVSDRLAKALQANGIGTQVDDTNIMESLNKRGWTYGKAYQASRDVVKEAMASNSDFRYAFDIHRDSQRRDVTTKKINGKSYARIYIIVGKDYETYEKNAELASKLHHMIEKKYPGLSRGVLPKGGKNTNGVFNQDLTENALLLEIGGVDNNLDELYRTADALAEVFSEFYWDAEKVNN